MTDTNIAPGSILTPKPYTVLSRESYRADTGWDCPDEAIPAKDASGRIGYIHPQDVESITAPAPDPTDFGLAPTEAISRDPIAAVRDAIASGSDIRFLYQKSPFSGSPEERNVEPDEVIPGRYGPDEIIAGYDWDAGDYRQFRFDRIVGDIQVVG